jgi:hypothetical protein
MLDARFSRRIRAGEVGQWLVVAWSRTRAMILTMDARETEQFGLARRAVGRWTGFPVESEPRPLVLAQSVITSKRGFTSGEAKDAWFDGSYDWAMEVPEGVRVRARTSADRPSVEPTRPPLKITHAGRGVQEFLTDRGLVTLPAYWLRGPSIRGSLWVLDPAVGFWEPSEEPGQWGPAAASLMRSPSWTVEAETDDQTISFPWMGSPSAGYRVELVETATAVSAVAIKKPQPAGPPGWYTPVGQVCRIRTRLSEPIGNRVFVDLRGEAMQVERPSRRTQSDGG